MEKLVQLASRQLGIVTVQDCLEFGLSRKLVRTRVESGEWQRLHRGIYKLGSHPPTFDEQEFAAMLAAGEGAALSHFSAARRLWLDVPRNRQIQVTIPHGRHAGALRNIEVFRSRDLLPSDVTQRGPFRITRTGRAVVDCASLLEPKWLRALVDSALRRSRSNLQWIKAAMAQHGPGRHGIAALKNLIAEYEQGAAIPDSTLESFAMELGLATGRKPQLHWNIRDGLQHVAEVDFAWPEIFLAVELDSWTHHGSHDMFQSDRERDRALHALGWVVLRFTWGDIDKNPLRVIAELARAYELRKQNFALENLRATR